MVRKINKSPCKLGAPIFSLLTDKEVKLVNESVNNVVFNAGEIIFKQGSPITHIINLNQGLAKVYIEGYNKKNLLLQYIQPNDFLGGPGAFVDSKHHFSLLAAEECDIYFLGMDIFRQLLNQNLEFANGYIKDISIKGIYNFRRFISLTQKQMHGRVADALLYYALQVKHSPDEEIHFSKQNIADYSGITKDSASRILKEFHEGEIIRLSGQRISILNISLLEQISEFG